MVSIREAKRKSYFLQTSGHGSIGDHPITNRYLETRSLSDKEDDVYSYLLKREGMETFPQRTTDIAVVQIADALNIPCYIIMAPKIFGMGTGPFNKLSIQLPQMIRVALKSGQAELIGDGQGVWSHIHVEDLAMLYETIIQKIIIQKQGIPSGKSGVYFATSGEDTWESNALEIGKVGKDLGRFSTSDIRHVTLDEGAERWAGGSNSLAEVGFCSKSVYPFPRHYLSESLTSDSARAEADLARSLGWQPTRNNIWSQAVRDDFKAVLAKDEA